MIDKQYRCRECGRTTTLAEMEKVECMPGWTHGVLDRFPPSLEESMESSEKQP